MIRIWQINLPRCLKINSGQKEQSQLLVPAAVSAHKSAVFFLLKQGKDMNLINGFDLLWKHTVVTPSTPFTDAVNIQMLLCIYSWMPPSIIVLDTVECLRQVASQWLQQILVLWAPRSEPQRSSRLDVALPWFHPSSAQQRHRYWLLQNTVGTTKAGLWLLCMIGN